MLARRPAVLRSAFEVRGKAADEIVRTCRIEPKALRTAEGWISERRLFWERALDRLGDVLMEVEAEDNKKKEK